MTRRSMLALGLLATLALLALALFWLQTRALESGANVLNVSGRQRMLSQRAALLTLTLAGTDDVSRARRLQGEIDGLARQLAEAHRALLEGDEALGLPEAPEAVVRIYAEGLDAAMNAYISALAKVTSAESFAGDAASEVVRIGRDSDLLHFLDSVVAAFQVHQERRIRSLQRAKIVVFGLTILVIILTRHRVIGPMVVSVRRHLRALREHHERLAHFNRLSTMGEMAAGIAHEINQPLAAIASYAQALRRQCLSDRLEKTEAEETLEKIDAQALRAGEVIRRIRALTSPGPFEREAAELDALVEDAVRLAETDARFRNLPIEVERDADLPAIEVDVVQIQQVVINLVKNALEASASKDGEAVRVRIGRADPGHAEIRVEDRGVGLPKGAGDEIFQPFFTTKASGTGLGLSISRSIAETHHGHLELLPREDGGTIARLVLPLPQLERGRPMG